MRSSLIFCLLMLELPGMAQQPGDLDSSFAVNGKFAIAGDRSVKEIVALPDGKILLMANNVNSTAIIRLEESGALDTTFGQAGTIMVNTVGVRLFHRFDGRIILIGNEYPFGSGSISCFLSNGQVDLTFGLNGMVSDTSTVFDTAPFADADMLSNGQLIVCGVSAFILSIDINGYITSTIHVPNVPIACPNGNNLWIGYESQIIRFMPNGQIWFYYRKQNQYCGPTVTTYTMLKSIYDQSLQQLSTSVIIPEDIWGNKPTYYNMYVPESGLYRMIQKNSIYPTHIFTGPDGGNCTGYEPQYLEILAHLDEDGIFHPNYLGSIGSKRYGKIAADQDGSFFVPVRINGHFWSYKTEVYCSSPYDSWGYSGYRPPEDQYPVYGSAEAAGVQIDGKVLIGGSTFTDGLVVYRYHNIPDPRSKLYLKMFLSGPYDPVTGLMDDHLRQQALIPFIQPYQPPAFQPKNGVGTWGLGAGVQDLQGDSAIVDWVWLELLDPDSLALVKATRVGLLHRNGEVTAADGISPIDFSVGAGSYVLRVRHRNHLSVTLFDPITLGVDPIEVDLTSPSTATFGTDAQKEVDGVMMLWPGDAKGNGDVRYMGPANDRDAILIAIGGMTPTATVTGYRREDVNLDGEVKYMGPGNDRDVILQTIGGDVPTAVRVE